MLMWESLGKDKSLRYVLPMHRSSLSNRAVLHDGFALFLCHRNVLDMEDRYSSTPFSMQRTPKLQTAWARSADSSVFLGIILLYTPHCEPRAVPPALLKSNVNTLNAKELSSSVDPKRRF